MYYDDQGAHFSKEKNEETPPPPYGETNSSANGSSDRAPLISQSPEAPSDNLAPGRDNNGPVGVAKFEPRLGQDIEVPQASGGQKLQKQFDHGYPLHECVFRGDVKQLSGLIRAGHDLSKVDQHGNSALHLAVMLGRRECVHLLCAHGAPVKIKNKQGWSPIAEAIRYLDHIIYI